MISNIESLIKEHKPDYLFSDFNQKVCGLLNDFVGDVNEGKSPRLVITMPPRSGKSDLVARYLPAFALLKNADTKISISTHSDAMSERLIRDNSRILDSLSIKGNGYVASGIDCSLPADSFDIAIIDDLIKDAKVADSASHTRKIMKWFENEFINSVTDTGGIVIFITRWHEDDLGSKIIESMSKDSNCKVLNFPAIVDGNGFVESYDDERFSLSRLLKIKDAIGNEAWNALYQGVPAQTI